MLNVFSIQNTATSALAAIAVVFGTMSLGGTAQAAGPNPLLGGPTGAVALSSAQMERVEGSGFLADLNGVQGINFAQRAVNSGRAARFFSPQNSPAERNHYLNAAQFAANAAAHFNRAWAFSVAGR